MGSYLSSLRGGGGGDEATKTGSSYTASSPVKDKIDLKEDNLAEENENPPKLEHCNGESKEAMNGNREDEHFSGSLNDDTCEDSCMEAKEDEPSIQVLNENGNTKEKSDDETEEDLDDNDVEEVVEEEDESNGTLVKEAGTFLCEYNGCTESYDLQEDLLRHIHGNHVTDIRENEDDVNDDCPSSMNKNEADMEMPLFATTHLEVNQARKRRASGSSMGSESESSRRSSRSTNSRTDNIEGDGTFFYYGRKRQKVERSPAKVSSTKKGKFICEYPGCGKVYQIGRYLEQHKYLHMDQNQWPYSCSTCLKKFYRKEHLMDHHRKGNCGAGDDVVLVN